MATRSDVNEEHEIPYAIIQWLDGLDSPPLIRVMGRSGEESEKVLKFLERLLVAEPPE